MAGRIGLIQKSRDGGSYGFVIYDEQDRTCVSLGFSSWHLAGSARLAGDGACVREAIAALCRREVRFRESYA